jgi:NDP-sugar pyrophosphorylase family protein
MLAPDELFFLMNGDIITELDFAAMARFHASERAELTIGYVDHMYQSPFGVLELNGSEIVGIREKPQFVHPVSAGIYCVSSSVADLVPANRATTMPELALQVRARGGRVVGYRIREFWRALERTEHFEEVMHIAPPSLLGGER